ncbi:MAG: putative chromosome-partitioning protein ParB [Tenericutes bacterium ADurb.Bin024]|nr:MAG: putative chromosome-partitioning protein ParB [Tenericutes bacterium ADurb.Bin024]
MKNEPKNNLLKEHLSDLISKYSQSNVLEELAKAHTNRPIQMLPIDLIIDNNFVKKITLSRKKIARFVENYQRNILLEPLVVRAKGDKYEVIIGRRRLAAARLTEIKEIPVIVMNYNDEETLLILLAKARDQLGTNVLELAYIFSVLSTKHGYSHQSLADLIFRSRSQVTNILRLLKLEPEVIKALNNEQITFGHARALVPFDRDKSLEYLELIRVNNLSVRELETLIQEPMSGRKNGKNYFIIQMKNKLTIVFKTEEEAKAFKDKHLK